MQVNDCINGSTSVFGVIGDPIEHTLSPLIHNTMAALDGSVYTAFHVKEDALGSAVKGAHSLGIQGLNVTVPHKKAIMPFLYDMDKTARIAGAVNTIKYTDKGYIGYNTDMTGVYYALDTNGVSVKGKTVLITGAGGAANACAAMAAEYGAKKIYIANRTVKNAVLLAEHIKTFYKDIEPLLLSDTDKIPRCELILNATTLGFGENAGKTPIEDISFFEKKHTEAVFDAIYSPWETKLLSDAASQGVKAINGFDMLVYQAVAAREIWLGKKYGKDFCTELRTTLTEYLKRSGKI